MSFRVSVFRLLLVGVGVAKWWSTSEVSIVACAQLVGVTLSNTAATLSGTSVVLIDVAVCNENNVVYTFVCVKRNDTLCLC